MPEFLKVVCNCHPSHDIKVSATSMRPQFTIGRISCLDCDALNIKDCDTIMIKKLVECYQITKTIVLIYTCLQS